MSKTVEDQWICVFCGNKNPDANTFCGACGSPRDPQALERRMENQPGMFFEDNVSIMQDNRSERNRKRVKYYKKERHEKGSINYKALFLVHFMNLEFPGLGMLYMGSTGGATIMVLFAALVFTLLESFFFVFIPFGVILLVMDYPFFGVLYIIIIIVIGLYGDKSVWGGWIDK